ncbi:ankyrin repeat domain-containing protein [Luteimonas saliphila]|uniref:ankyrin repeat domain-containing protein n=1 Tax=Luteimonas saliphila TaxID=2804919 RepID=UPI0023528E8E|nr:ankyrin repeat domain-containing protein [Luteimonas saliphila]
MTRALLDRIATGRTDLVLDFVAAGGSASATDSGGVSLIQWCAYYGDVSALRYLLTQGENLRQFGPDLGLNAAAFHGYWQLCQFLLENSAPASPALPTTGETPLHSALCSEDRVRYDPVVRVLLSAGADPNATTVPGAETGAFMRDCRTKGETPLHRAAAFGAADTVQILLNAGARPEVQDTNGDTPLAWASWYRRPAEILRLLCYGPFSIHPQYQGLRANLVGDPLPKDAP